MKRKANEFLNYDGQNPFSDSQSRNFSDSKVSSEFYPTSTFWSLFNDQHEVLIGTRGSGKTFLLKMMRQSMLKRIKEPIAKEVIDKKEFIALYVPMQLELLSSFNYLGVESSRQITLFQFYFNSVLAKSLLDEVDNILSEESDLAKKAVKKSLIAQKLNDCWFENPYDQAINDFQELSNKITQKYYSFDLEKGDLDTISPVFKRQICSTLISAKSIVEAELDLREAPTWIVCVDEAEFLNETLQRCINSVFRSNTSRIALKVATLPFYHLTLETLTPDIEVSPGNDFNYRIVDLKYDSPEFKMLSNKLCSHRISTRVSTKSVTVDTLEDFLGTVGNDDLIDYYRAEVGQENSTREVIEEKIISSFSEQRKSGSVSYSNKRKTIYDKFAPIFFVREMYKRSQKGNSKPGWYAGATTVRKISQGNPRLYIQIMNALFEKARKTALTPKAQHEVLQTFSSDFHSSTQALDKFGPATYDGLDMIGNSLKKKVHEGNLISAGCCFKLKYKGANDFDNAVGWLQKAIAYSRIYVADEVIIHGLTENTKYLLSNIYAALYWIPMRGDTTTVIPIKPVSNMYMVEYNSNQLSIFEEDDT